MSDGHPVVINALQLRERQFQIPKRAGSSDISQLLFTYACNGCCCSEQITWGVLLQMSTRVLLSNADIESKAMPAWHVFDVRPPFVSPVILYNPI